MSKTESGRTVSEHLEPLAVSPRQACFLLGVGNTRLYQLIGDGELSLIRMAARDGSLCIASVRAWRD